MKIFKFNPKTGTRGEQIDDVKRAGWTWQSVDYQVKNGMIEPIDCVIPEVSHEKWTLHVDAGATHFNKDEERLVDESYLRDEWICFCLGEYRAGQGQYREKHGTWEWVILPPKSAIKEVSA